MKKLIIILAILILSSSAFAHGIPELEEFKVFPGTFTQAVIANPAGGIVAIPFAAVGAIVGAVMAPFDVVADDIDDSIVVSATFTGLFGYVVGQQIAWPFYGIEKCIGWCFE